MVSSLVVVSPAGFAIKGIVFADEVEMASRVKLNAEPKEGVGTVNADVAEERVLETRGSEGGGVTQPRTAGEKDPGVVVGEGSVEELALVCRLVDGSSPKCCPFVNDGVCSPV